LPFRENQRVLTDKEIQVAGSNDNGDQLTKRYRKAVFKRRRCYTRLYNQVLVNFRQEYFRTTNSEEIRKIIEQGEQGLVPKDEDPLSLELKFVSYTHFPDRNFIATSFWASCKVETAGTDPVLISYI
jgi:hypothetical protein